MVSDLRAGLAERVGRDGRLVRFDRVAVARFACRDTSWRLFEGEQQ
jgi:hypothetical protein